MADIELDELLLAASQDFEEKAIVVEKQHVGVTTRSCRQKQRETPTARFANPTTTDELKEMVQEAVPAKTRQQTKWAVCLWMNWRMHRIKVAQTEEDCPPRLADMSKEKAVLAKWLSNFIVEIRRSDGKEYIGSTLHQILCSIQRHLREHGNEGIDLFSDPEFRFLKSVLDSKMKKLRARGIGTTKKQAEPLSPEEEEMLWEKDLLGDKDPQTLLDTMLWMCGIYFALRSGQEHRNLRPAQIELTESAGESAYVVYHEDVSKNNPGGINHRKIKPKSVVHYASSVPERCFVRLYKLYCSKCPEGRPEHAFYLTPLAKPTENCWYSREPVGHNPLGNMVKRLCEKGGISGYKTNHSLRASAATRLFQHGVDEQLIMGVTGHRSVDGVRSYKRVSREQHKEISTLLEIPAPNSKKPRMDFPILGGEQPIDKENVAPMPPPKLPTALPVFNVAGCNSVVINYHF